jgi:MFS family permease
LPLHKPEPPIAALFDFRPVLRNRPALGYILAYGAHCFELYGMRTWLVAFWSFVVARTTEAPIGPIALSFIWTVLAMPSSILGNEAALRFGRHRAIAAVMCASALTALAIGLCTTMSPWLLLILVLIYGLTVPADSGALTSGMAKTAFVANRGATMALHSAVGFGLSAAGAWGVGATLDAGGGPGSASGWRLAFAVLAAGILMGPVALWWSRRT